MPNKSIELSKPVGDPPTKTKTIYLREPEFADMMEVGDPYVLTPREGGNLTVTPIYENIRRYSQMLLVNADGTPGNTGILSKLSLEDAFKVRNAITGFFLAADPVIEHSPTPPTTSSSNSDGTQAPSSD